MRFETWCQEYLHTRWNDNRSLGGSSVELSIAQLISKDVHVLVDGFVWLSNPSLVCSWLVGRWPIDRRSFVAAPAFSSLHVAKCKNSLFSRTLIEASEAKSHRGIRCRRQTHSFRAASVSAAMSTRSSPLGASVCWRHQSAPHLVGILRVAGPFPCFLRHSYWSALRRKDSPSRARRSLVG